MKRFVIALSAIALFSTAAVAGDITNKKVVPFGDLNLSTQDGVAALRDRLVTAAAEVCGPAEKISAQDLGAEACRKAAVKSAVADVTNKITLRLASVK